MTTPPERSRIQSFLTYVAIVIVSVVVALAINGVDPRPAVRKIARPLEQIIDALPAPNLTSGVVRIATWHIRSFSLERHDDRALEKIADIVSEFDVVAVQGIHQPAVLDHLMDYLSGWRYVVSPPLGPDDSTERYAFLWRSSSVDIIGEPAVVGDRLGQLEREPFVATFRSGGFDFTLCTIRIDDGGSIPIRRRELRLMDEVVDVVRRANGDERDVILLGDFSFPPEDRGFQLSGWHAVVTQPQRTTVGNLRLSDNILFDTLHTREFAGESGIVSFDADFYNGDAERASRAISDHRPVWASFHTTDDDDLNAYGDLSRASLDITASP